MRSWRIQFHQHKKIVTVDLAARATFCLSLHRPTELTREASLSHTVLRSFKRAGVLSLPEFR